MSSDWGKRLAELQAAREARQKNNVVPLRTPEPEDIPDELAAAVPGASITEEEKELPQEILSADQELARFVEEIKIRDAYERWIGGTILEGQLSLPEIRVSCPLPDHADKKPSACINIEKNTWMCYPCDTGGDVLDLAAIRFNLPNYKQGQDFHNLYREIGKDFGWIVENQGGVPVPISPTEQVKKYEAAQRELKEQIAQLEQHKGEQTPNNVIDIETGFEADDFEDDEEYSDLPKLDWRPLVKEGTFLDEYMKAAQVDHFPEEFHFWNALQAIGLAIGRHATTTETLKPFANLFLCFLGRPALGKSGSVRVMESIVTKALPFDPEKPDAYGAHILSGVSSGEQLVQEFVGKHVTSPKAPPLNVGNIKGLVVYDEFTDLAGRASRLGNIIKPKLQEFYDCKPRVENRSKTGGRDIAINPFLCFSTSVQPDIIRNVLSKDDANSGFLSRFIFVTGTRKKPPAVNRNQYNFSSPITMLKLIHNWAINKDDFSFEPIGRVLDYSEEAEMAWTEFHDEVIDKLVENGPNISSRLGITMRKLVLIFAANSREDVISKDSVERAKMLWDYLVQSYLAVDNRVSRSLTTQMEDEILSVIQKIHLSGKPHVTISQIVENRRRKGYTRTQIEAAINTLVKLDEIEEIKGHQIQGRGRKPKVAYIARRLA